MHPVANVGLSSTLGSALVTLLSFALSLAGVVVPSNAVDALTVIAATGLGYLIHTNTGAQPNAT